MKWKDFRRSENVEDFTDPTKPSTPEDSTQEGMSINDRLKLTSSDLAKDAGAEDVKKPNAAGRPE